eukprot:6186640-Pleurochrysis_carterae.AAC.1
MVSGITDDHAFRNIETEGAENARAMRSTVTMMRYLARPSSAGSCGVRGHARTHKALEAVLVQQAVVLKSHAQKASIAQRYTGR